MKPGHAGKTLGQIGSYDRHDQKKTGGKEKTVLPVHIDPPFHMDDNPAQTEEKIKSHCAAPQDKADLP